MSIFLLPRTLAAWNTADFDTVFKQEAGQLDAHVLPLQQGLSYSSSVAREPFQLAVLATESTTIRLRIKASVFYAGMVGGCNCADDPTPQESQPEYCELWFEIDRHTGQTRVCLVRELD